MVSVVVALVVFIVFWLFLLGAVILKHKKSDFIDEDLPCKVCCHANECMYRNDLVRTNMALKDLEAPKIANIKLNCILYDEIYSNCMFYDEFGG